MYTVLITVLLLILLFIGVRYYRQSEGFADPKKEFATQKEFGDQQDTYYHKTLDKAVFINPGIQTTIFNNAVKVPDLSIYFAKFKDYLPQFMINTDHPYDEYDKQFCKRAKHPRNLPKHDSKPNKLGCGWYFSPDPTVPSFGALGISAGPVFNTNLPPNGTWIWSKEEAIEQEDIKYCSNIRSCDLLNVNGIYGICGFCTTSGYSIPIDSSGKERYPNNPKGICGVPVSLRRDECLTTPSPPVYASNGKSCGRYGYPSELNDIRLYRKGECDALSGNWVTNGECLKPEGGSFSWDCRSLNLPKPAATSVCTPNNMGNLTRNCLITLAKGVGFLPSGRILHLLTKSLNPTRNDREVINILASVGVDIPDSVLGRGNTDAVTAGNTYKRIMEQIERGNTEQIREAAKLLAVGSKSFDVCDIDDNERGPFAKYCLQQAFRRAGCQAYGTDYPYGDLETDKVWSEILNDYKNLYASMDNHQDPYKQKQAIKKCLGITVPDMGKRRIE